MLGTIYPFGIVKVAMREPGNVSRRKAVVETDRKAPGDKLSVRNYRLSLLAIYQRHNEKGFTLSWTMLLSV